MSEMAGKNAIRIERYAPADAVIPKRLGGGKLKELVERELPSKKVVRYSLAYINPMIFTGDNGRVLGYDNEHGHHHRHYMGKVSPVAFTTWEDMRRRFEAEWRQIAMDYANSK